MEAEKSYDGGRQDVGEGRGKVEASRKAVR
jgi:hypothetical protein